MCQRITSYQIKPRCMKISYTMTYSQPSSNETEVKLAVFGKTKIMHNRFIAACNVAHCLCRWNLLLCVFHFTSHVMFRLRIICLSCDPRHLSVVEYLTSTFTDMCVVRTRNRGRKICGRADADAKNAASAHLCQCHACFARRT